MIEVTLEEFKQELSDILDKPLEHFNTVYTEKELRELAEIEFSDRYKLKD